MPPVNRVIGVTTSGVPASTIRTLHAELATLGLPVAEAEESGTRFGADTQVRVREFQTLHRLPDTGEVDETTGAVMTLAALASSETDPARLRTALREARAAAPVSDEYAYWLSRYALVAGDYDLATRTLTGIGSRFVDLSDVNVSLGELVMIDEGGPRTPRAPEVPFPENFYTYRYSVMAQDHIEELRRLSSETGSFRMMMRPANGSRDTFDPPHEPVVFDPGQPTITVGPSRGQRLVASALAWLGAIEAWQYGNAELAKQRYASAVDAYNRCQQATLAYFATYPDYNFQFTASSLPGRMDELVHHLRPGQPAWAALWQQITWRRQLLSLAELSQFDWTPITPGHIVHQLLTGNIGGRDQPPPPTNPIGPAHRKMLIDARLLVIAAVLVPLARGEANRQRREYAAARADFVRVLRNGVPQPNSNPPQTVTAPLMCEFIERPFAQLLLAETTLEHAEAQYKARLTIDAESTAPDAVAQRAAIDALAQDFTARQIPGDPANAARPFQHLAAAVTYAEVLDTVSADGQYVARAKQALDELYGNVTSAIAGGDITSLAFKSIGHRITIPTVASAAGDLPGLTEGTHPHEPYVAFALPEGQAAMRERNPRVYALLLQAESRVLQIWSGFNYLGYRDDYVPPWRFQFLLDRARYFSSHAKNAQRDYLNFLNNAENEEFKEASAAQNVEMEKANVQIETARVDQATKEVTASIESAALADLQAANAQTRLDNYVSFDRLADSILGTEDVNLVSRLMGGTNAVPLFGSTLHGIGTAIGDFFSGGAVSRAQQNAVANAQRALEKANLELALEEAEQGARVAAAKLEATKASLVVSGLQRQAALLRHAFALQNLQFMRNRALNSEQWYRLAHAIRGVGETYLRYAIETSFLAQQAYNFESDRRLDVIRFDYDMSDVGAMLAADFLMRDVDTLEQDLIVSQQTRQQQVRVVVSMAREFPEALRELADTGEVSLALRLEQLERHFPGLFNLRLASVDVLPVALMDPTRIAIEVTHLGAGSVRLKAQPGSSPLNQTDLDPDGDWMSGAAADWPVKFRHAGPETTVFTGITRQDLLSSTPLAAIQRGAFEGLPAAAGWRVRMSMRENQVVPGSLADMRIILTLTGFYDGDLQRRVADAMASTDTAVTTSHISARRVLPDAYYSLVHHGRASLTVTNHMLSLAGAARELRNLSVLLPLAPDAAELGRSCCRYPVRIDVADSAVSVLTQLPQLTLAPNGLTLACDYTGPAQTGVTWDFGDDSALVQARTTEHTYARPGRYGVSVRLVGDGTLVEYRAAVVVSAGHVVVSPLVVVPAFSAGPAASDGTVPVTIQAPAAAGPVSLDCSAGPVRAWSDAGTVTLHLMPGSHVVELLAVRTLSARFYGKQRYAPDAALVVARNRLVTNRTFDPATDAETTAAPSAFTDHLFDSGARVLSPVDRWTVELPLEANPWFLSVSPADVPEFNGSELADAILSMEFKSGR